MVLVGCVLPSSLEEVRDDINFGPVITPDPPATTLTTIPNEDGKKEFTLTVEDPNVGDTIYVKYFLDYVAMPGDAIAGATTAPPVGGGQDAMRIVSTVIKCGMLGENAIPTDGKTHILTAVVADRPFVNELVPTPPKYRHVTPPGKSAEVEWQVECLP